MNGKTTTASTTTVVYGGNELRMRMALRRIAAKGCERLVDPSTCRKPNGYPKEEWCDGCIAAEGLGLSVEWFVLKP